jgi:hypothetical protein
MHDEASFFVVYCREPLSNVLRTIIPKAFKPHMRFALLPSYV